MKNKEETNVERDKATLVSLGLILRIPMGSLPDLEQSLNDIPGIKLVFQKLSAGRLEISEFRGE